MSANLSTVPESAALSIPAITRIRTLASELEAIGKKLEAIANTALSKAIECGRLLSEAKEQLGHGAWLPWLADNFTFKERTAQRWMKVAEEHAADNLKYDSVTLLSEAYQLTTTPRPPAIADTPPDEAEPDQDEAEPDPLVVDGTATPPVEDPPSPPRGAAHVSNNCGNNEWFTPSIYIEAAREVMGGIDLDPASCAIANKTVGAAMFYDKTQDGLTRPWKGRVWMNPPYAQPLIKQFADRLVAEVKKGAVTHAIALVNNGTETEWFQAMAGAAAAICFPKGRVRFTSPDGKEGSPLQGQSLFYFGNRAQRFIDEFKNHGQCVVVMKPKTGGTNE
jgi:ParB family chromosome partitioning protein